MSSMGYFIEFNCFLFNIEIPKARVPILPISIRAVNTILLTGVKFAVIPVERPTVPNAETTSKQTGRNSVCSKNMRMSADKITSSSEPKTIAVTLFMRSWFILRLKITTSVFPINTEIQNLKRIEKEVVLIPPPVLPGEAPMNINRIKIKMLASDIAFTLTELKPVVDRPEIT